MAYTDFNQHTHLIGLKSYKKNVKIIIVCFDIVQFSMAGFSCTITQEESCKSFNRYDDE